MKKIPEPEKITAIKLKPAEMNKIHFGGNHTPLTPDRLNSLTPPHAESQFPECRSPNSQPEKP